MVVGAGQECHVGNNQWFSTVGGYARRNGDGGFLGDSRVDVLAAELFALLNAKTHSHWHCRRYHNYILVFFYLVQDVFLSDFQIRFAAAKIYCRLACGTVERHCPMPSLAVLFGEGISFAFYCMYVNDNGFGRVLYLLERLDERGDVVAVFFVDVVQPERTEPVVLRLAVALSQFFEILIDAAVSFGNGLFVVVNNNDEIAAKFRTGYVEGFHRLAARKRTVADDCHDVFFAAENVATLGKSERERDGRGGVSDVKKVMFAFLRI